MNSRRTFIAALPVLTFGVASGVAAANEAAANEHDIFDGSDAAKTVEEIKKSFLFPADWSEEEFEGRKLLFALLVQPTDGISVIDLHGWIYSEHFKEWRRFLKVNTRHLGSARLLFNKGIISIRGTANGKFKGVEVLRFDLRVTSNDAD